VLEEARGDLSPYLPRLARTWGDAAYREVDGTLVSVDLSGFTALSERLAQKGRAGAEELILVISGCFEGLIRIAELHGGDVLKFRGDALLLLYEGADHAARACTAASKMQWFIANAGPSNSSVGPVSLSMSTGVHSGTCHLFAAGTSHRELIVTGPSASETIRLEDEASSGQVLVSLATAEALPAAWVGEEKAGARVLRLRAMVDDEMEAHAAKLAAPLPALAEFVPVPLRAPLAAGVEPEHRHVVAAFVKFKGIEQLLAEHGAAELARRLAALGEITGSAVDELGLTWLESDIDVDGGKLYLTGGAPLSTGDDETAMLEALRRVVGSDVPLELRAGVNAGRAFAGDVGAASRRTYAVTGDTVNVAARIVARAEPRELLATAAVLESAALRYATSSRSFVVKGKQHAITAYGVGDVLGAKQERAHELPLVGRDAELSILAEALDAARHGETRLVEIVGEPGIGKSRLLEELRERAAGFQQLAARGEPYATSTPYGAFHGLLRPLAGIGPEQTASEAGQILKPWIEAVMPDLAPWLPLLAIPFNATVPSTRETDSLDATFVHERLHGVVGDFLRRALVPPSLVVVEDAHWLDDASEFLLRSLARADVALPWVVIVTRRPTGASFVSDGHGTSVELAPLPPDAAVQLALRAAGESLSDHQLAAVGERSGGNPLFVRELVAAARTGLEELPQSVETLMTARIDTLDPSDRRLLRYAAVVGPAFDLDVLYDVLRGELGDAADRDRWERLSEFVAWQGSGRLTFNHDLFRTTAYEGLSIRRRRDLHGRVGTVLEQRAGDAADESAALLSLHFFEAGVHDKAWRYGVLAGHHAKRAYANVVAAELFERALAAAAHLDSVSRKEVASTWEALGDVRELFAGYERAAEAYANARALVRRPPAQSRLLWKEGRQWEWLGRYADALSWYGRALSRSESSPETLIEIELAHASVRQRQGDFEDMAEWCRRAAEHARAAESKPGLAHAYYLLDMAHTRLGRPTTEFRDLALPIYEEIGDLLGQAKVLNNLGTDAYFEGRWHEAVELYTRCRTVAQQAGDVVYAAIATNNVAEILSDQGRLDEARVGFDEALRTFRTSKWNFGAPLVTSNIGRLEARAARFGDAERLLVEARESCRRLGSDLGVFEAQARLAECYVLAGRYRDALELEEELDGPLAGANALRAMVERVLGYAHAQARRRDAARKRFARSLEIGEAIDAKYEIALTSKALADARLADTGERSAEIFAALEVVSVPEPPLP
jgi:class 3 adenylate cyclase/tetratricopeptide (TPR) repeat protein